MSISRRGFENALSLTQSKISIEDRLVTVTKVQQLHPSRKTLHRLTLEPLKDFPQTIIAKQQKKGWEEFFEAEIQAYTTLRELQGEVIPHYYGRGLLNEVPALFISDIAGITLHDLACSNETSIQEICLEKQLQISFQALSKYGAVHWDVKLDNFLFCHSKDCGSGKMMIIDLESVTFSNEAWEIALNSGNVFSLMSDFKTVRNPNRPSSPVDWSNVGTLRTDCIA